MVLVMKILCLFFLSIILKYSEGSCEFMTPAEACGSFDVDRQRRVKVGLRIYELFFLSVIKLFLWLYVYAHCFFSLAELIVVLFLVSPPPPLFTLMSIKYVFQKQHTVASLSSIPIPA